MGFGIKLQLLRKERRMSQEALTECLGVFRRAVSKLETGDGYPKMDKLITIFGVTLDYLMKEEITENIDQISKESVVFSTNDLNEFFRFNQKMGQIIASNVAVIFSALLLQVVSLSLSMRQLKLTSINKFVIPKNMLRKTRKKILWHHNAINGDGLSWMLGILRWIIFPITAMTTSLFIMLKK